MMQCIGFRPAQLAFCAALLSGTLALAAPPLVDPVFPVVYEKLPNGLEIWVKPRVTTQAVDVRVVVKVGFRDEAVPDSGISHLLEHMLFKGTTNHSEVELNRMVENKGAYSNGETWPELTLYEVNIIDRHFPLAVGWLADVLRNPLLAPAHLEQARRDVYSEQQGDYSPLLERIFESGLFQPLEVRVPDTFFPHAEIPDRVIARLDHVSAARLREYYRRFYVPNNMAVIIVGNVDPADAIARVRSGFGDLAPRTVDRSETVPYLPPRAVEGVIRTLGMPPVGEMTEIWTGTLTRGRSDPDRIVLKVITTFLDRRIYEEIRSKRALGYSLGCVLRELSDSGIFYGYVEARRGRKSEQEALRIMRSLITHIAQGEMSEQDLAETRDTILGRQARIFESNAVLARVYQDLFVNGFTPSSVTSDWDAVQAVTLSQVRSVAAARLKEDGLFVAVARPPLTYLQATVVIIVALLATLIAIALRFRRRKRAA